MIVIVVFTTIRIRAITILTVIFFGKHQNISNDYSEKNNDSDNNNSNNNNANNKLYIYRYYCILLK